MSENSPESPIRVFLLLQNRLLRDALNRLFRKRADFLVVGCSRQKDCSPQRLLDSECDVLVLDFLDVEWLPANLRLSADSVSELKCVLICMSDDSGKFLAAVRGGTTGYFLKEASVSDVFAAVRATFRGEAVCSPKLCAWLFQELCNTAASENAQAIARRPPLTLRQQQLMALVARGLTNGEIASHLNLSEFTVKNHVHRIMKQFDAGSRSEAVDTILSHGYSLMM